jgi:hypothetical protein
MPYKDKDAKRAADARYWRRTRAHRKNELIETTTLGAPLQAPTVELKVASPKHGLRIAVVPDAQVRKGVPIDHLAAYGEYIAAKQPDVIVCIGDFADVPSLSTYLQPGSVDAEGARYADDLAAVYEAMEAFMTPIAKAKGYSPKMILTYGNHEDRITRAVNADPRRLMDRMSLADLKYEDFGWTCVPFLQPVAIGGVAFCHYFPSGIMGRPVLNARTVLQKLHMSAYAGHQQGRDIAYAKRADGGDLTAIISGSFYQHDEGYLSPFTNKHWRGAYFLHEVKDGQFDEMALSVGYLKRRFG